MIMRSRWKVLGLTKKRMIFILSLNLPLKGGRKKRDEQCVKYDKLWYEYNEIIAYTFHAFRSLSPWLG